MEKQIITALAALIIGAGLGYILPDIARDEAPVPEAHTSDMHGAMEDMTSELLGKTGDAFDQAFLREMILHHEGAVAMAEAALESAKHDEIKKMAEAIISAQTSEIREMKDWLNLWYPK
jgi:uncharacterized protein (DUF305 family)